MPMFTAKELADLRSDLLDLMPDSCRIERPSYVNPDGYAEEGWGTAVVSIACRFDPDTTRKDVETVADREAHIARYIVTLPYDADIQDGDRLAFSGKTYEVLQIHDVHSDHASRRLRVSIIRGD